MTKLKNKGFEELVSKLEAQGYIVERNPTDIDTIDPENSARIEGWWKEMNGDPHASNRAFFGKEEAERLAMKIEKTGLNLAIHIHGWHGNIWIDGEVVKSWVYDLEITPSENMPEITQMTLLWNTGEETQVMPPYENKLLEAFKEETESYFRSQEYDLSGLDARCDCALCKYKRNAL